MNILVPEFTYGIYYVPIVGQQDYRHVHKGEWFLKYIHTDNNPLMDEYHLMGDGKRIEGEVDIYQFGLTSILDFGFPNTKPIQFEPFDFIGEGDSNKYIPLFSFGLQLKKRINCFSSYQMVK